MTRGDTAATDGELATRYLSGDEGAARQLLGRYREPVYRLVRSHIVDPTEAVDVTQETFVAAFANLSDYDSRRPLRPWLFRIAINKCRDWARRRAVRSFFSFAVPLDIADDVSDGSSPIDQVVADRQELARVQTAIARLPQTLKEPLVLRAVEGMSEAEVATVLKISRKAVETRLYRARRALVAALADSPR